MSAVRHQRMTVFAADDVTPIVGTVDINGNVTDPTCSTDSAHARPYLIRAYELSGTTIDFINGSSTIGQMNVEILDKRTVTSDQTSGWFTNLLADANGIPQISGHRILFEQQDTNGNWYTVMNGIAGDVKLKPDKVTYTIPVRDMRERERNMRLFDTNNGILTVLPIKGCVTGWGRLTGGTRYVVPPAVPIQAKFYLEPGTSSKAGVAVFTSPAVPRNLTIEGYRGVFASNWVNDKCAFVPDFAAYSTIEDAFAHARATGVQIWWRASGSGGAYTVLSNLERVPESVWTAWGTLFQPWMSLNGNKYKADTSQNQQGISMLSPDNPALLPTNGQSIELLVVMNAVPTESEPLYLELTFGQLLKNIYDGMYSPSGTLPVRYDSAAMAAMVTNTPTARLKITEPVSDARTWIEDNIYKPLGYAPLLTSKGEIKPVKYTLPDPTVSLVQLDNTNIVENSGDWTHSAKAAVTKVVFKYITDMLSRTNDGSLVSSEREDEIVNVNASASIFGNQTIEYAPVTVRSLIDTTAANSSGAAGEWVDDLGGRLARERAADLLTRFSYGAQSIKVSGQRSDPVIAALTAGDWVLIASSWMPDYTSRKRGANRVCQVVAIQDTDPATRSIELLDGGAALSPVAQPTLSYATYNSATGAIDVALFTSGGVEARVDFASSGSMPTQTSGLWTYGGRANANGLLSIYDIGENSTVWVRCRGEMTGRRPSAWTTPVSVSVPIVPRVFNLNIELKDGSDPVLYFEKSSSCGGVRIEYAIFGKDDALPTAYTAYGDAAASSPITLTGIRVPQFSRIMVRIQAYQGYSGGSVTGTAGSVAGAVAQRVSDTFAIPQIKEVRSQTDLVGTLVLEPTYDPQYRITKYEFRTQEGNSGVFTAWAEDAVAPYSAQVNLVDDETSVIEYRVTAIDMQGENVVIVSTSVGYSKGPIAGFVECRAAITAATATLISVTVTAISPDGGTPNVELVAVTGSASLYSGPAIGVDSPSGTVWQFTRGAALAGNGQVQFRAFQPASSFQTDDDFVEIPEQGRDTTYAVLRARVTATSDTSVTIRVAVADPYPQGANTASIAHVYQISSGAGTVDKTSPQLATPEATLTENAGTYVDYVVTRPAAGTGAGRITFTVTIAGRVSDSDAVDVPAVGSHVLIISTSFSHDGAATVNVTGANVIKSIRLAVSTVGFPSAGTVGAATPVNASQAEYSFAGPYNIGTTLYCSAIGYSEINGGGTATAKMDFRFTREGQDVRVQEKCSESGNTGTVQLITTDPNNRIQAWEYRTQSGRGAWSAWAAMTYVSPNTYEASVTMTEKVVSKIGWRILGVSLTGQSMVGLFENVVTFAMGPTPIEPTVACSVRDDGKVDVSVTGDSDTASLQVGFSTSSQSAANSALGSTQNARTYAFQNVGTLTLGQKGYVAVKAWSGTGASGYGSVIAEVQVQRFNVADTVKSRLAASAGFHPATEATGFGRGISDYAAGISDPVYYTGYHYGFFVVPKGVTLRALRVQGYCADTNDTLSFKFYRVEAGASSTQLGTTQTLTGGGTWTTKEVTSLSEDTTNRAYIVQVYAIWNAHPGPPSSLLLGYLEAEYDKSAVNQNI